MKESLTLKWGTLKGWDVKSEASTAALKKYFAFGVSMSAMAQHDSPEQKEALLALIDAVQCEAIYLDWDNKHVTKEEAKEYVLKYGQKPADAS